jgi:hypothetical protein
MMSSQVAASAASRVRTDGAQLPPFPVTGEKLLRERRDVL